MNADTVGLMVFVFVLLLMGSAFFALSEVAFVSLNKLRLRSRMSKKKKNARLVQNIVGKMDKLIATILVGNNFVNIALSAIGTAIFIYFFGNSGAVVMLAALSISVIVLILGEITPKVFAVKHAETVSFNIAWLMSLLMKFLEPLVRVFLAISNGILRLAGEKPTKRSPLVTEEEIRLMIELGRDEGVLTDAERRMLHRIFEFGDTQVFEVMVAREKIVSVGIDVSIEELLDVIIEEGHSRIPVCDEDINNIRGIIYARELLNLWRNNRLIAVRDLIHPAYFIHYRKRVSELLREFQRMRVYLGIVVDDHKNTLGLVTVEDLLEEIVGEID